MKRIWITVFIAALAFGSFHSPAFAIKEFGEAWNELYTKDSENEEFKKLVGEAKCNVCHIQGENKKKHNPYGDEVEKLLKKKDYPKDRFKKEPEKVKQEMEEAFKKIEELQAKDGKTYGQRIKEGLLPGGNVEGK